MTNKELSSKIREQLKAAGYTCKDVSISIRSSGYGDTYIKATIRNPKVNKIEINNLIKNFQDIDYDVDGSILQGGNDFVIVKYKDGVFNEPAQEWIATAKGVFNSKETITKIFNGLYFISENGRCEIRQQDSYENVSFLVNTLEELAIFIYKFAQFKTIAV